MKQHNHDNVYHVVEKLTEKTKTVTMVTAQINFEHFCEVDSNNMNKSHKTAAKILTCFTRLQAHNFHHNAATLQNIIFHKFKIKLLNFTYLIIHKNFRGLLIKKIKIGI